MGSNTTDETGGRPFKGLELTFPEAVQLAEFHLIAQEIADAIRSIELLAERFLGDPPVETDHLIGAALFRDAIVQFVGCFEYGRYKLSAEDVYGNVEGGLEYFQWLLTHRNSYAAHNVGPQRQCTVIGVPDATGCINAVGQIKMVMGPYKREVYPDMLQAMKLAHSHAVGKISQLEQRVLELAKALTPEEVAQLHEARVTVPASDEIGLTRKQFRERKRSGKKDQTACKPGSVPPKR